MSNLISFEIGLDFWYINEIKNLIFAKSLDKLVLAPTWGGLKPLDQPLYFNNIVYFISYIL